MKSWVPILTVVVIAVAPMAAPRAQQPPAADGLALKPTNHPRVPADLSRLWMAPSSADRARTPAIDKFASAVKLEVDSSFTKALPILSDYSVQQGTLGAYAEYYKGLAQLRLGQPADARKTFESLALKHPDGYLTEATALREAEANEAAGDQQAAFDLLSRLAATKTTAPDDVLMRLGKAAKAIGNADKATEAYSRVVYEFPFSDLATTAAAELEHLPVAPIAPGSNRYKLELGRAERLFGAKRYVPARAAFEAVKRAAQQTGGDDAELVALRLAECDYFGKKARIARDALKPYTAKASRQGEALFFYAVATRELGDQAEYLRTVRRIVDEFPNESWAEEALNNLATHQIVENDDAAADATFREMFAKYPGGHYAERAAWKIGWWAYKNAQYAETVKAFESGAAHFPRSDYRPSWLYWSARAHEQLHQKEQADANYTLVATDYLNTYYGRLAVERRGARAPERRLVVDATGAPGVSDRGAGAPGVSNENDVTVPALPSNAPVVRALLGIGLYDQALDELRYAQKVWGDSPPIQATIGWIYNQRGDIRAGINAMKRAYPQYMAAGGEQLPPEILHVVFPVSYWPLIRKYSDERQLDPFMMAALIAQESNFDAGVRSPANAYGLMQILPSTGRQYARSLHMTAKFSIGMLTKADTNISMGTAKFADLMRQFGGGAHYALASYNAGENRVARWISERPGIDQDEFIDDIPFPETQGYVKRILGTAEDYRHLYGNAAGNALAEASAAPPVSRTVAPAPTSKKPAPKKKAATKSNVKADGI
jgi:soluble lytic murein transglycosylase